MMCQSLPLRGNPRRAGNRELMHKSPFLFMDDLCLNERKGMDFFMWHGRKSLAFSKACVLLFMAALAACAALAPILVTWLTDSSAAAREAGKLPFLITLYTGCVPAAMLLACLYALLHRIGKGRVFVKENATSLRYISWCCFAGAAICLAAAYFYIPWIAVSAAAGFMGIIVRVVRDVFAKAIALEEDAAFTI